MLQFNMLDPEAIPWQQLDSLQDRTIFQTKTWLEFLEASQGVKPIVIEIKQSDSVIGYFTGAIFKKFGIRILGSSFPGWTTGPMGFNLLSDIPLELLIEGMVAFAFSKLKCWHMELYDERVRLEHILYLQERYPHVSHRVVSGWLVDISGPEDRVFKQMSDNRRSCIKKAAKNGLVVEVALDESFADDYYDQHVDVFKHQGLVPTYTKDRVRKLIQNLAKTGQLLLVRSREAKSGICIGSGIFLAFNRTMYSWGTAAFRAQLHHHPNESMHWFAIRYWRDRGMTKYDMMGGGDYKKRYGGRLTPTHWIAVSRFGLLMYLRNQGQKCVKILQKIHGKFLKRANQDMGV